MHKVCVTFDQPLWLKAITILKSENLPIVCRLGGFHILMIHEYYWKCKERNLMKGSGFEELLFLSIQMRFCVVHLLILLDRNQSQSVITNLFKQQQLQLFQCFLHFIRLLEKRKQKT